MKIGSKVKYIGGQAQYRNPLLLAVIGRTGTIRSVSSIHGFDWDVEMDEGCIDLDAQEIALIEINDDESVIRDVHSVMEF